MKFTKMHGAGNDYVYVNCFEEQLPQDIPALAREVSDRHTGIGGDGLILICPSEQGDARMRMFNADGSESEMCGNGIRCVAKYVFDHDIARKEELKIETGAGVLTLQVFAEDGLADRVRVNMGKPILNGPDIPTTLEGAPPLKAPLEVGGKTLEVTCISMGNPHCITFVDEVTDEWVHGIGPQIEVHPAFPNRVNAEFIQIVSRSEMIMRVWERGSGETQACGTGACASAVAAVLNGLTDRTVLCHLPGGDLTLEWAESGEVYMTGPATEVFHGEWAS
ncbi:diaminopimelate epimerase [Thalassoglobus polymorphus]|uniref:Diaminopimelate epimerase n=1 Tax=Thalassoglobus polymorphus TaxID=2527994 RepID=A0A517QIC6_9PLAN|nr:diaminopimelate epimerase [Thalassoglobus polymorphus]QDT31354.1 Diaminopimelate epimerase [Thalassoglobus polymorphus]